MTTLQVKLDDEVYLLESLLASLGRGQSLPERWTLLHEAAARDERIPELAFAYERLIQDKKLKFFSTSMQCEILMHAATFLADAFGDVDGATGYLNSCSPSPPRTPAFAKMEAVLTASANAELADVYATAATHRRIKDEQVALLRRAAELADGFEGARAGDQDLPELVRVDPSDHRARGLLEQRLRQAGKFREVARLIEPVLSSVETSPRRRWAFAND